jgi:putative lipoic acid-binding regulatory protein
MSDRPQGFEFPCEYAVKAMGLAEPGFDALVVEIVRRHCPDIREGAVTTRPSRNGRYLSVTVLIEAHSHSQLNAIYADLTAHDKVLMRL